MIEIRTNIKKNVIEYTMSKKLRYMKNQRFVISYTFDLKSFPLHLANFMVGILLSEHISWTGEDVLFSSLTKKEVKCINKHILNNFIANPYKRVINKCPEVHSKNISKSELNFDGGPVITMNGMGKDGLALASLVRELNIELVSCVVANQYKNMSLWKDRARAMKKFYSSKGIIPAWVGTSYFRGNSYKIIPWQVFAFPVAWFYSSRDILIGFNLGDSKFYLGNGYSPRPNVTVFSFDAISKATGFRIGNPFWGVSHLVIQRLILERYPEVAQFQRSCMRGIPWCGRCGKCLGINILARAGGNTTKKLSLRNMRIHCDTSHWRRANPLSADVYMEAEKKLRGEEYQLWIEKLNLNAQKFAWHPTKVMKILKEHVSCTKVDPGKNGLGYTNVPSIWSNICLKDKWSINV